MTDMVTMLLVLGAGWYAMKTGMLDDLVEQLKGLDLGGGGAAPAPVPEAAPAPAPEAAEPPAEGGGEEAPAEGGGGAEPAAPAGGGGGGEPVISGTNATLAGCGCSCMNMDSDKTRWKIETASGTDCYNHVYPGSIEECATALKEVCAGSCCGGGGGGGGATPAATEGGGGDKAAEGGGEEGGGEDSGGEDKKSNYSRTCTDYTPMNWA